MAEKTEEGYEGLVLEIVELAIKRYGLSDEYQDKTNIINI